MAREDDYSVLGSDLGDRRKPVKNGPAIEARATRAWIDALPRADNARTAAQLLTHLRAFNRIRVTPGVRAECLELLRKVLADAELVLERQLISGTFPLVEAKRRCGDLLVDCHLALASGYRAVVFDLCGARGKIPMLRGATVATAVERALHHYACALVRNYQMYLAVRPGVWLMMNALYRLVVSRKLAAKAVADVQRSVKSSPEAVFHQALLLALTNPYRLTQAHILEVNAASEILAVWLGLNTGPAQDDQLAVFPVDDRGPGYAHGDVADSLVWHLDTTRLQEQLQKALAESEGLPRATLHSTGSVTGTIDRELLERLMLSWGVSTGRGHARLTAEHQLDAAVGLAAAHYLSASGDDFETFLSLVMRSTVLALGNEQGAVWGGHHDSVEPPIIKTRVLDQSLGGYRVAWEASETLRARVGELVVVVPHHEDAAEPSDWMLCVIRWLLSRGDGYIEAGIELLARRFQPVAVRVSVRGARTKPPQRGLLLEPLSRDQGVGRTLVVPSLVDVSQGELQMARPADALGEQPAPELDALSEVSIIEDTGAFKLVRFRVASEIPTDSDE